MPISAPINQLRRKAKLLSRQHKIPLHQALDRIAAQEGFRSWSLLVRKTPPVASAANIFARLSPGDFVLVGARPGQGKTLLSLSLAVEAMKAGNRANFFTLEYSEKDIPECFQAIGAQPHDFGGLLECDCSDQICSDHIIARLAKAARGSLAVVDYLQLLDQKRENPELNFQLAALKSFARDRGVIMVFISQIDRSYDPIAKPFPDLRDIRRPNPLDLSPFNKTCFLNNGAVRFQAAN